MMLSLLLASAALLTGALSSYCPIVENGSFGICTVDDCKIGETVSSCADDLICCASACGGPLCTQPVPHDCTTKEKWSDDKEAWCCNEYPETCPKPEERTYCPMLSGDSVGICTVDDCEVGEKVSSCPGGEMCCPSACGGPQCMQPVEHDCTTKETWSDEKRKWCYKQYPELCPKPEEEKYCPMITSGAVGICIVDKCQVGEKESSCADGKICCPSACGGVRCTEPVSYDCSTKEMWSKEKEEWCCNEYPEICNFSIDEEGFCPMITEGSVGDCSVDDCKVGEKESSCAKGLMCCTSPCGGPQCTQPVPYNCYTYEKWSKDKTEWCCNEHPEICSKPEAQAYCPMVMEDTVGICVVDDCSPKIDGSCPDGQVCCTNACGGPLCQEGVAYDCRTRERWTDEKREFCCGEYPTLCPTDDPCNGYTGGSRKGCKRQGKALGVKCQVKSGVCKTKKNKQKECGSLKRGKCAKASNCLWLGTKTDGACVNQE